MPVLRESPEAQPLRWKHIWSDGEGSALALTCSQSNEGGAASQKQVPTTVAIADF